MFPFRYRSLFRSRWLALLWAIGVCWTAVEVADWSGGGDKPAEAAGDKAANVATAPADDDLARLEKQVHAFEGSR